MADRRIILVSGISGTDINGYSDKLAEAGNKIKGEKWIHVRFRDYLKAADQDSSKMKDLDWSDSFLRRGASFNHIARTALENLINDLPKLGKSIGKQRVTIIISMHITLRRGKTLTLGLELWALNALEPKIFITIIKDALDVWGSLRDRNQDRWKDIGPLDILEWREFETFISKQLANFTGVKDQSKPFFLLSHKHPPESLPELINNQNLAKLYRSYPITFVKDRPKVQAIANQIGEELSNIAIAFNPMGITDYDRLDEFKEAFEAWCDERGEEASALYWNEVVEHISQHTVSRDHQLIDQSDGIVVYYPELLFFFKDKKGYAPKRITPFSSGVLDEMNYATQRGKKVYLIWPTIGKDDIENINDLKDMKNLKEILSNPRAHPGPFLAEIYTNQFENFEDLLSLLQSDP